MGDESIRLRGIFDSKPNPAPAATDAAVPASPLGRTAALPDVGCMHQGATLQLPDELTSLPAWLVWRYESGPDDKKPRKVPYYVTGGRRSGTQGSAEDVAKLATFDEAVAAFNKGGYSGLGLAMLPQWGMVGLDFDACVDQDGNVDRAVERLVEDTYAEVSPSGTGVRAFMRGALVDKKDNSPDSPYRVEVFCAKGFLTITGRVLDACKIFGSEKTVEPLSNEVAALYESRFGRDPAARNPKPASDDLARAIAENLSDETREELRSALAWLPSDDRDLWIAVGQALKPSGEAGRELWWGWSLKSLKFDQDDAERVWESLKGDRTGYAAVFAKAQRGGWKNPKSGVPPRRDPSPATGSTRPRSAAELLLKEFAPMRWVIPNILPEGVYLLAAAPKIGKSWLALQIAIAVGAAGEVLGQRVEAGEVLYLGLEDGDRRLQSRLRKLGADFALDDEAQHRVWFETNWPRVNEGGAKALDEWLEAHPDTRLVVIDVLERFRAMRSAKGNLYAEDYAAMAAIKAVAEKHHATVLVVHHTRKTVAEDVLEMISGTQGLAGGADGVIVLKRARGVERAELHLTGRDLEREGAFVVEFVRATCRWELVGSIAEVASGTERQNILDALRDAGEPMKSGEIASAISKSPSATSNLLRKLVGAGSIVKGKDGRYALNAEPEALTV